MDYKENEKNSQEGIIFCKPINEHYYEYGVNNVEKTYMITKDDLRKLLIDKNNRRNIIDILKALDTFQTFILINSEIKILDIDEKEEIDKLEKSLLKYNNMKNEQENNKRDSFISKTKNFLQRFQRFQFHK